MTQAVELEAQILKARNQLAERAQQHQQFEITLDEDGLLPDVEENKAVNTTLRNLYSISPDLRAKVFRRSEYEPKLNITIYQNGIIEPICYIQFFTYSDGYEVGTLANIISERILVNLRGKN